MRELTIVEAQTVDGGSVLGVLFLGTVGFWVGGTIGFFMSAGLAAIPGALIGMTIGAVLGMDSAPQIIVVNQNGERIDH